MKVYKAATRDGSGTARSNVIALLRAGCTKLRLTAGQLTRG
jgi:hypothetical protein